MSTTIRQSIVNNVITALQTILVSNGFNTDVGVNVFEWLEYSTDSTVRPCLIVRDRSDKPEKNEPHVSDRRLTLEILIQTSGTACVSQARSIIGDIYDAIKTGDSFGGYVYWIEEQGDDMEAIHEEDKNCSDQLTFTLFYKTEYMNMYNVRNV